MSVRTYHVKPFERPAPLGPGRAAPTLTASLGERTRSRVGVVSRPEDYEREEREQDALRAAPVCTCTPTRRCRVDCHGPSPMLTLDATMAMVEANGGAR